LSGDYEKTATKQQMTFLSLCTDAISLLFFAVFAVGGKIGWRYKASNFAGQLASARIWPWLATWTFFDQPSIFLLPRFCPLGRNGLVGFFGSL